MYTITKFLSKDLKKKIYQKESGICCKCGGVVVPGDFKVLSLYPYSSTNGVDLDNVFIAHHKCEKLPGTTFRQEMGFFFSAPFIIFAIGALFLINVIVDFIFYANFNSYQVAAGVVLSVFGKALWKNAKIKRQSSAVKTPARQTLKEYSFEQKHAATQKLKSYKKMVKFWISCLSLLLAAIILFFGALYQYNVLGGVLW